METNSVQSTATIDTAAPRQPVQPDPHPFVLHKGEASPKGMFHSRILTLRPQTTAATNATSEVSDTASQVSEAASQVSETASRVSETASEVRETGDLSTGETAKGISEPIPTTDKCEPGELAPHAEAAQKINDSVPSGALVEWDHKGRPIKIIAASGSTAQFRYDSEGKLYAFTYAKLAWRTSDGIVWSARDSGKTFSIKGHITVAVDGTIKIKTANVVRTLLLTGERIDSYSDGSQLKTHNVHKEAHPADVLATELEPEDNTSTTNNTVAASIVQINDTGKFRKLRAGQGQNDSKKPSESATHVAPSSPTSSLVDSLREQFIEMILFTADLLKKSDSPALVPYLDILSDVRFRQRQLADSEALSQRSQSIRRRYLGHHHPDTAVNLHRLAQIRYEYGNFFEAEKLFKFATAVSEKGLQKSRFMCSLGLAPGALIDKQVERLITHLHGMAQVYAEQHKPQLSKPLLQRAEELTKELSQKSAFVQTLVSEIADYALCESSIVSIAKTGQSKVIPWKDQSSRDIAKSQANGNY